MGQGPCSCFRSSSPPHRPLSKHSHTEIRAAAYGWGWRGGHWEQLSGAGQVTGQCGDRRCRSHRGNGASLTGLWPHAQAGTRGWLGHRAPWGQASEAAVTTLYHPNRREAVQRSPAAPPRRQDAGWQTLPALSAPLLRCHAGEGVTSCSNYGGTCYGQVFFQKTVSK